MGVAHHHLERPVPEQLCDGAQIHPGHHESTGKSMAVAMPGYTPRSRPLRVPSGTSPATPAKCPRCGRTGRPDRFPAALRVPRSCFRAPRATVFSGMVRGSPVLGPG
jgi:hypothetical protein